MYVLRYRAGGPSFWQEYAYGEVVEVHNKIAVVRDPLTVEYLKVCTFDLLGEIHSMAELPAFMENIDKPKEPDIFIDEEDILLNGGGQTG